MVTQVVEPLQGGTFRVDGADRTGNICKTGFRAGNFIDRCLEVLYLFDPELLVPLTFHLGDFHDVGRDITVKQFPGFLFGVAGGLAIDQIHGLEVGADLADLETEGGFDHRTDIARQNLLCIGNRALSAAAQADTDTTCRYDQLFRHIDAEGADNRLSALLDGHDFMDAPGVNILHHAVKVGHCPGRFFCERKILV